MLHSENKANELPFSSSFAGSAEHSEGKSYPLGTDHDLGEEEQLSQLWNAKRIKAAGVKQQTGEITAEEAINCTDTTSKSCTENHDELEDQQNEECDSLQYKRKRPAEDDYERQRKHLRKRDKQQDQPEDKERLIRFRDQLEEVHYIVNAPPAYHVSRDMFQDGEYSPEQLTVAELREALSIRRLDNKGTRTELVERLKNFLEDKPKQTVKKVNFSEFYKRLKEEEIEQQKQKVVSQQQKLYEDLLKKRTGEVADDAQQSSQSSDEPSEDDKQPTKQGKLADSPSRGKRGVLKKDKALRPLELSVSELKNEITKRGYSANGYRKYQLCAFLQDLLNQEKIISKGISLPSADHSTDDDQPSTDCQSLSSGAHSSEGGC
eukprot:TRINITY_DN7571_c0_g1_i1.p1 TRINITY_DN7571_c0_g1~~TRINITY_DN7571_c0_g1_i1.p1  ORF type:complete len:377 (-),score=106.46 TRINITY_DN7571_c0_g1_i1:311-1441(-)